MGTRMCVKVALAASLAAQAFGQAPAYTVSNYAGNGVSGYLGDGGQATAAQLSGPIGMAMDSSGNLYVADTSNNVVRKIGKDGVITTVAGKNLAGYSSDEVTATSGYLHYPTGVAVDKSGVLYIADSANHVIKKVTTDGKMTTFAGANVAGYADFDTSGKHLEAKYAHFNTPMGVAVDSAGNVFIADTLNHVIRKVGTDGLVYTVAGKGGSGYSGDDGVATNSTLNRPISVAIGADGSLYIADQGNHKIRKVGTDGNIRTFAGLGTPGFQGNGGPANLAQLYYPTTVALNAAGVVFIADTSNNRIRRVGEDNKIAVIAGSGKFGDSTDGEAALTAKMKFPTSVLPVSDGRIFFTDSQWSKVKVLTPVAPGPTALPVISEGGVGLAAEYGSLRGIAPGAWIEIDGAGLTGKSGEAKVTIDGQAAVVASASESKLKVQAPFTLTAGERTVVVSADTGDSKPVQVQVAAARPGLEAPAAFRAGDQQLAWAVIDGSEVVAAPEGTMAGIESRPAKAGETLVVSGTGFGAVTPMVEAGETAPEGSQLVLPVRFLLNDTEVQVLSAGMAAGKVGVYEFRLQVPAGLEAGLVKLRVIVDGQESDQNLFVAVGE